MNLMPVEYSEERVLTTEQLAQAYECSAAQIKQNFNNNISRFEEGKHFFKLMGDDLKIFKNRVENFDLVGKNANALYLWTKRGAARHSKMLGTDKAWEVFETLEENYFSQRENIQIPVQSRITFSGILHDVDESKALIQKIYRTQEGIATAHATTMVGEFHGYDLSPLQRLILPAEHETGYMNASQVGVKVSQSARKVNQMLIDKGLQVKDGKGYRLTDKGKLYGEEFPYDTGKHSGYQIKWNEKVVGLLVH